MGVDQQRQCPEVLQFRFIRDRQLGSLSTCWIIKVFTYTKEICNKCSARTDAASHGERSEGW